MCVCVIVSVSLWVCVPDLLVVWVCSWLVGCVCMIMTWCVCVCVCLCLLVSEWMTWRKHTPRLSYLFYLSASVVLYHSAFITMFLIIHFNDNHVCVCECVCMCVWLCVFVCVGGRGSGVISDFWTNSSVISIRVVRKDGKPWVLKCCFLLFSRSETIIPWTE